MRHLSEGVPLCLTVTLLDGFVMAKSAFHHSMNYRSVMVHGCAVPLRSAGEKTAALDLFVERVRTGRSGVVRAPNPQELKATEVLAVPLVDVVAKMRTGGPLDDTEDLTLPVWAGVVPLRLSEGEPVEG
jgi:nitroimidazol reductase NimA-like FMN-containing flavoprotein (pyridoxamine 5'-phosphate oxidase superfamily)